MARLRLFGFERRWLLALFDVLIPSGASPELPLGARDVGLEGYVDELVRYAPLRVVWGVRACLWLLVFCPLFVIGRWRSFFGLAPEEQLAVLERLRQSPSYLVREMPLLFKMLGCLGYGGHPEIHAALGIEPRDREPPSWARREARP